MPITPNGWNQKATIDEHKASAAVGGFSKDGTADYHAALRVLSERHISAGLETNSDVVELIGETTHDSAQITLIDCASRTKLHENEIGKRHHAIARL